VAIAAVCALLPPRRSSDLGSLASTGSPFPAFTAELDWLFDTANPVGPEDGQPATLHPLDTHIVGDGTVTRSPDNESYPVGSTVRSEEHTSALQSRFDLVCR